MPIQLTVWERSKTGHHESWNDIARNALGRKGLCG
jgi:hypothetical protein